MIGKNSGKEENVQGSSYDRFFNHAEQAKKYLEEGLKLLVEKGDINGAVDCFYYAASAFDRAQEFRQVPALWEAIGKMLEPDFPEVCKQWLEGLRSGNIEAVYQKWYGFPLIYRIHATTPHLWKEQTDPVHKQAWAYQWAAEHLEAIADYRAACVCFVKAGEKAEQTKDGQTYPDWPAKLYYRAILNYIRAYGTLEHAPPEWRGISNREKIQKALRNVERLYLLIPDKAESYRYLANTYRSIKASLLEAGNLAEAESFRKKERSALMRHYFYKKRLLRALIEWLSGEGFLYFIIALFVLSLGVFPYVYYHLKLITSVQGDIKYLDALLYSLQSSLNIGDANIYPIGYGRLLSIVQAGMSWMGLGIFLWWLTKRLE